MSDPGQYREKSEIQEYKENRDPITNFKKVGIDKKVISEKDIQLAESKIKEIVAESIEFADNSPEPIADELWSNILNK